MSALRSSFKGVLDQRPGSKVAYPHTFAVSDGSDGVLDAVSHTDSWLALPFVVDLHPGTPSGVRDLPRQRWLAAQQPGFALNDDVGFQIFEGSL